jgi:NAD(P)-dependent dehydrogenase (short-subunit alcohol dehydrogenase family)
MTKQEIGMSATRPFAIITGASTGIGFELAKRCAKEGYDLLIAADEPAIEKAATALRGAGAEVEAVQADLATTEGVDKLYAAGRRVVRLMPCWQTPGAVSATDSWIRILARRGGSSKPMSPTRSI